MNKKILIIFVLILIIIFLVFKFYKNQISFENTPTTTEETIIIYGDRSVIQQQ
jgi:hypothetical protein